MTYNDTNNGTYNGSTVTTYNNFPVGIIFIIHITYGTLIWLLVLTAIIRNRQTHFKSAFYSLIITGGIADIIFMLCFLFGPSVPYLLDPQLANNAAADAFNVVTSQIATGTFFTEVTIAFFCGFNRFVTLAYPTSHLSHSIQTHSFSAFAITMSWVMGFASVLILLPFGCQLQMRGVVSQILCTNADLGKIIWTVGIATVQGPNLVAIGMYLVLSYKLWKRRRDKVRRISTRQQSITTSVAQKNSNIEIRLLYLGFSGSLLLLTPHLFNYASEILGVADGETQNILNILAYEFGLLHGSTNGILQIVFSEQLRGLLAGYVKSAAVKVRDRGTSLITF